jgi:succinate-semialdehyde dehydrogenase / glutarate-semialdehyde dehydrogenase
MTEFQTINPANGEVLGTYQRLDDDQLEQIIAASHDAFTEWSQRDVKERAEVVGRIGDLLRERAGDLADRMSAEMGKLRAQGTQEIELCAAICDYTAAHAADQLQDETRSLDGGRAIVTHQPQGIILGIQPFNFPVYQALRFSVPALAAGNTVLLRHATSITGSGLLLEQLYHDAGVPEAAFRLVLADHDQISTIIADRRVRGVTLTGSDSVGRTIAATAGEHLKKTVMELGSNDAYVVLSDADLDLAVRTCVQGRIVNNGETCVAAKRMIVHTDLYDDFRDAFVAAMADLTVGDPFDDDTDVGPLAREDLRDDLHEQVRASVAAGATVSLGGEMPDGPGFYYPVTVLEDVAPGQPAYDDELFGPVASLIRAESDEDAMRIANDSRYGLGGGIFSADVARAVELARTSFDTGMVNVNGYRLAQPNLPFGGVKDSGYGREHGGFGIKEFVNTKTVMVVD